MPRLWVLLPCYNEAEALPLLLPRLRDVTAKLDAMDGLAALIVDDGSTDASANIAAEASATGDCSFTVELVQHERNRGLGCAMQTGLRHFLEHAAADDWLAAMDCDNTHPPELLAQMLNAAQPNSWDVVIASRYAPGGSESGLSASRRFYSHACSTGLRSLFRLPGVRDYTCGYRLYRGEALRTASKLYGGNLITEHGFTCQAELLIHLARSGAKIGEVPFALRYDEKRGRSKMKVAQTIWRYTVLTLRELFACSRSRGGIRQ
jgi:dolichol-phosphate mannosyltransferase